MSRIRPGDAALWVAAAAVLALKLLFLGDKGTGDMDVAIGWGHTLLERGLVDGYTGSNFPIAFQVYEGLIWLAGQLDVGDYLAMKALNLLSDVGTFLALRLLLRRWGLDPRWAFAYWLSPYFLVMAWLGYDHFQMGLLVVVVLLLIDRAWRRGTPAAWALASFAMGVGFLQRPQFQALVAALGVFVAIVALGRLRRRGSLRDAAANAVTAPALWLMVGPVLLFGVYTLWFWIGGRDAFFLLRSYGSISAFSPAFSANMLNLWAMVAEAYRSGDEQLTTVSRPQYWHQVAAVLALATLLLGTWAIARRADRRPFPLTALYLFAFSSIALPHVYTRAHENHFFLGALLLVPLVAVAHRRRGLLLAGAATSILQAFNMFAIYGFGAVGATSSATAVEIRSQWTWDARFVAAAVVMALFLTLLWLLRPLAGREGESVPTLPAPAAPAAPPR